MNKFNIEEQEAIYKAINIIESLALNTSLVATSSQTVKDYCVLKLASSECEKFGIMFLTNSHKLISFEVMSTGTTDRASVYSKECIKKALELNACAVVLTHNHPGENVTPSGADKVLTNRLVKAFELVDIRVLDHIIVSCTGTYSFKENCLL